MDEVPQCCRDGCQPECYRNFERGFPTDSDGPSGSKPIPIGFNQLNFSIGPHEDEEDLYLKRKLAVRDPMSHRIIEKRRRDRMNNCLADLSRLIPADYLKKGRGRIEKTEIIEMAIKHMRHLQTIIASTKSNTESEKSFRQPIVKEHYRLGYLECLSEAMHFLVEIQGFFSRDPLCMQLINHLHKHCDSILKGDVINYPRIEPTSSGGSSNSSSSVGNSPPLALCSNPSNGGSSEHSHSEYAACSSENDEPVAQGNCQQHIHLHTSTTNRYECIPEGHFNEEVEESSQLRDMLTNQRRKQSDSSGFDTGSSTDEHPMYKFKNTIQQRYNESQKHDEDVSARVGKKLKLELEHSTTPQQLPQRLSFGHKTPQLMNAKDGPNKYQPPGVPIFALHTNGTYYIPMTLDQQNLAPHLSSLYAEPAQKVVLHPVTISVNFQTD